MPHAPDIIGRRPVIIGGILGVSVTTLALGFSKTLMGIIGARFLGVFIPSFLLSFAFSFIDAAAGLSAGNVAVVHSVLGRGRHMAFMQSLNHAVCRRAYGLDKPGHCLSDLRIVLARWCHYWVSTCLAFWDEPCIFIANPSGL